MRECLFPCLITVFVMVSIMEGYVLRRAAIFTLCILVVTRSASRGVPNQDFEAIVPRAQALSRINC
jgi:uncharacterized membrane protein